MIDKLLSYVAPHLCCGCGKIGTLLCDNCKYDIISESYKCCISCGIVSNGAGICRQCDVAYERAWCVGERSGVLQRLVGDFKFQNMFAAYHPLSELFDQTIDQLPLNTVVVPIPTVASHIRERGYDHTLLVASQVARVRKLKTNPLLRRINTSKQRGVGRADRIAQAKSAFAVEKTLDPNTPYLLIDDIVTTGATIKYAAEALRSAGATQIWVAVIARQPLD